MEKFCPLANFAQCIDEACGMWGLCNRATGRVVERTATPAEWIKAKGEEWFEGVKTSDAYEEYRAAVEAGEVADSGHHQRWFTNRVMQAYPDLAPVYANDECGCGLRFKRGA